MSLQTIFQPEDKPEKNSGPPSGTLILRALAGGYLLYLSWDLIQAADIDFQLIGGVFAVAGAILLWRSLMSILHNDYFYDDKKPEQDQKQDQAKAIANESDAQENS